MKVFSPRFTCISRAKLSAKGSGGGSPSARARPSAAHARPSRYGQRTPQSWAERRAYTRQTHRDSKLSHRYPSLHPRRKDGGNALLHGNVRSNQFAVRYGMHSCSCHAVGGWVAGGWKQSTRAERGDALAPLDQSRGGQARPGQAHRTTPVSAVHPSLMHALSPRPTLQASD